MRPDVKLGVVVSLVVVLGVGGYFLLRGKREAPIPVSTAPAPASPKANSPAAKPERTAAKPNAHPGRNRPESVTIPPTNRTTDATPSTGAAPTSNPPIAQPAGTPPSGVTTAAATNTAAGTPAAGPNNPTPSAMPATTLTSTTPNATPGSSVTTMPGVTAPTTGAVPSSGIASPSGSPGSKLLQPGSQAAAQSSPRPSPPASPFATSSTPTVAPSSSSTPVSTVSAAAETHRVQSGDSFASLARQYYGSERYVDHLVQANPQIKDPARLSIGMAVTIPSEPQNGVIAATSSASTPTNAKLATKTDRPSATAAAGSRTYQVKQGDSFYAIARDMLGDANRWNEILAMNREKVDGNPNRLRVGQVLLLPGS